MKSLKIVPDLLEFTGLTPTGNATRLFHLPPGRLLEHFERTNNRSMYNEAWLVPEVCENPTGIWRGYNRNGQDEAFCYCGVPLGALAMEHNVEVHIPVNKIFLVFVTAQFEVTKWRFCQTDGNRTDFPVGHDTRFGERLWPQQ